MEWTGTLIHIPERSKFPWDLRPICGLFAVCLLKLSSFRRFHCSTCFNRLDLPNYTSKKELYEKLKAAITLSAVGFDME